MLFIIFLSCEVYANFRVFGKIKNMILERGDLLFDNKKIEKQYFNSSYYNSVSARLLNIIFNFIIIIKEHL